MTKLLEGITVIDLAWIGVGPMTSRYLAWHGAEVIRIETSSRLDVLRTNGPFPGHVFDINKSGMYTDNNCNKSGITLNLNHPSGVDIARRLISRADVLVENFTPKAMKKWGLTYHDLVKIRPDIIMISLTGHGQTGPYAMHPGAGFSMMGITGIANLTGWPDQPPGLIGPAYSDWIAPHYGAMAVMSALRHRRRTGQGQYIDVSQYECGIHSLGPAIMDWAVNGRLWERQGDRDPAYAPHGVYRCRGDERWVAIAVTNDREWDGFCRALGDVAWTKQPRFDTMRGRVRHVDELDKLVESWTIQLTPEQAMARLQAAGVPAGVAQNSQDCREDPQLNHRHHFWLLDHATIGQHAYSTPSAKLSGTPHELYKAAPLLGQDNEHVYRDILGLNEEEFIALAMEGVFE
ncbi:MAG: CoA transferase [Chloroflexi bacterium]|nr:CoA transferase [Chloroflexota bacterium]